MFLGSHTSFKAGIALEDLERDEAILRSTTSVLSNDEDESSSEPSFDAQAKECEGEPSLLLLEEGSCSSYNSVVSSLNTDSSYDTENHSSRSFSVIEVERPKMTVFGDWEALEEREVIDRLHKYGQRAGRQSFLNSLKNPYIPSKSHELVIRFVTEPFENIKKPLAEECYDLFNKTLFKGRLHRSVPVVKWEYCGDKIGEFRLPNIYRIAVFYADDPFKVANIMLHLMCLAAVSDLEEPSKSEYWKQWAILAKSMFPEVIMPMPQQIQIIYHGFAIFRCRNVPALQV